MIGCLLPCFIRECSMIDKNGSPSVQVIKLLKSKEASNVVDIKSWPGCLDTDELAKRKLPGIYRAPTPELVAYLDFSVSTTGMLAGIKMSHSR